MADLFKEIIPSILQTKEYALLTEQDEKSYSAFMVNRALSYHRDTVLWANEVNKHPNLDNLSAVKEYYGYSDAKAEEALKILSPSQITAMKTQLYKGD